MYTYILVGYIVLLYTSLNELVGLSHLHLFPTSTHFYILYTVDAYILFNFRFKIQLSSNWSPPKVHLKIELINKGASKTSPKLNLKLALDAKTMQTYSTQLEFSYSQCLSA